MIRRALLTSVVVSLALAVPPSSQAQSVYVLAGGAFPTSDFGEVFDTGWMVAGGLKLPIGPGGFWLGIEGSYGRNGTPVDGVNANPAGAMAKLGFNVPAPAGIQPFVFGGAGLLATKFSVESLSETESKFGYQLGAGLNLGSGMISPFVEVRFESSEDIDVFAALFGLSIGLN